MLETIIKYDKVNRLNREYALAYYNRGTGYFEQGWYQLAVDDYSEAIRIHPRDAEPYAARAFCYALLGRDEDAERDVEHAVTLGFVRSFLEQAIKDAKRQPAISPTPHRGAQ